jgi:hypothetical protein
MVRVSHEQTTNKRRIKGGLPMSPRELTGVALEDGIWMSKEEAAAFCGVKVRSIERKEAAGCIRKQTLPREPGQTTARVVYSKADLVALKAGAPNDYRRPASDEATPGAGNPGTALATTAHATGSNGVEGSAQQGLLQAFGLLFERVAPRPEAKPWLTLEEAADFSGLTQAWLLRQAEGSAPFVLDLGKHSRGGRYRFRRKDFESLGG